MTNLIKSNTIRYILFIQVPTHDRPKTYLPTLKRASIWWGGCNSAVAIFITLGQLLQSFGTTLLSKITNFSVDQNLKKRTNFRKALFTYYLGFLDLKLKFLFLNLTLHFRGTFANKGFEQDQFRKVSSSAIDCISKLLKNDPAERFKAKDCLEHQWLNTTFLGM